LNKSAVTILMTLMMCATDKVDIEADFRSMTKFQRCYAAAAADKSHHMTRRIERRKLQRNRTAFTQSQIEQLEQGASLARLLLVYQ